MDLIVQIGSDSTSWTVQGTDYETVVADLSPATGPVVLSVSHPLEGQLVISPRFGGSVAVMQVPPPITKPHDWNPSQHLPKGVALYVPSVTGQGAPIYAVTSGGENLLADIKAAMSGDGTALTVGVTDSAGTGTLVLNGAALPYVVLVPVAG